MAVVLTFHLKVEAKTLTISKHISDSFHLLGALQVKVQWGYSQLHVQGPSGVWAIARSSYLKIMVCCCLTTLFYEVS